MKTVNVNKDYKIVREFNSEKTPENVIAKIIATKNKKKAVLPS